MLEIAMCPPYYLSTSIPNNQWMVDLDEESRRIDIDIALKQFYDLYSILTQYAFVYLIPPKEGLQDQVYIVNAGIVLPHMDKTAIISKFRAEGREGEEKVFQRFLEELDFDCYQCPYYFEGEAELKWLHDNVFVGGYGIRSSKKALEWIENNFDAKVIKLRETDPYLYHLDCWVFPISNDYVLISSSIPVSVKEEIKKESEVIEVPYELNFQGITNSFRAGFTVFNANNISAFTEDKEALYWEKKKNEMLQEICSSLGLELYFVELTEYLKSGALLSCMISHITWDEIYLGKP